MRRSFIKDPSLILYLPLYKLDGNSFMSQDAYGHLCTVYGATWGIQGRYFITDDYILIPNKPSLQIDPAITYEFWVNQSALKSENTWIFNNYANPLSIDLRSVNGDIRCRQYSANGQFVTYSSGDVIFTTGVWYHIVATISSGVLVLYSNSVQVATATNAAMDSIAMTTDFLIGTYNNTSDYFNGYIGELRIYNRALSVLEIQKNYLATKWRYR